jgi:hypothetical protein
MLTLFLSFSKVVDDKTGVVTPDGTSVVLLMVRDAYANYVVQTTLDVIPECEEKRLLLEELNAHSTELVRMWHDVNLLNRYGKF